MDALKSKRLVEQVFDDELYNPHFNDLKTKNEPVFAKPPLTPMKKDKAKPRRRGGQRKRNKGSALRSSSP